MGPSKGRLLESPARTRLESDLPARTWNAVRVGEMPVSIDQEQRPRDFLAEGIARVHTHHQIRREIAPPGSRVREVVFDVQGVVADQTAEDSTLQRKALAHRRKIRPVRGAE